MKRATAVATASLVLLLAGCGESSPSTLANRGGAEEITMPDGFSNAVTKCDHGNRLYLTDQGGLTVVPHDPTCAQ